MAWFQQQAAKVVQTEMAKSMQTVHTGYVAPDWAYGRCRLT